MQLIKHHAYARAGLAGNPSDGYNGKTVSLIVRNFWAEAVLYEWEDVDVVPSQEDQSSFQSVAELVRDVRLHGYYGGIRLVKAAIKKFVEVCENAGHELHDRNFSIRCQSNIPRQVGLAGSSAMIVATLRCLMDFYDVRLERDIQPSLALAVETEELGIAAGLQDRVIQVYEGLVYMDFAQDRMRRQGGLACGVYEPLDPKLLPPLYLAYSADAGEPTEVVHNNLRARYDQGDTVVHQAMHRFAEFADRARQLIEEGDVDGLSTVIDENFDLRRSICPISSRQEEMIETARAAGASAKFAGSGGAIIGVCPGDAALARLRERLEPIGCRVIRPIVHVT